jgi:hypothetical protein
MIGDEEAMTPAEAAVIEAAVKYEATVIPCLTPAATDVEINATVDFIDAVARLLRERGKGK